jgi:3-phenylpropionate/trans-cinnamate dioxygenase ferredoxin reductase component
MFVRTVSPWGPRELYKLPDSFDMPLSFGRNHRCMDANGVVIVGGGLAGQRCCERLRRRGYEGRVRMVCAEPIRPYDRPPLSKELLAGDDQSLTFRDEDWYRDNEVELLLGTRAERLQPAERTVVAGTGERILYDKLLVATGSSPRRLPEAERFRNVHVLRTLADAHVLRDALRPGAHLVVIGGGFIGLEVAATARKLGVDVTIVEAAGAPLEAVLGTQVGGWFAGVHSDEGVRLELSTAVDEFRGNGSVEELRLRDGRTLDCDAVLVAIGVAPALDWTGDGSLKDLPDVHVAGDAAGGQHWEAAAQQGTAAADAMLGLDPPRAQLPSFWSDQYGTRIQYLGDARRADSFEVDGSPAERDFTALFTRAGKPVAALMVGRPRALPQMRRLIGASDELQG